MNKRHAVTTVASRTCQFASKWRKEVGEECRGLEEPERIGREQEEKAPDPDLMRIMMGVETAFRPCGIIRRNTEGVQVGRASENTDSGHLVVKGRIANNGKGKIEDCRELCCRRFGRENRLKEGRQNIKNGILWSLAAARIVRHGEHEEHNKKESTELNRRPLITIGYGAFIKELAVEKNIILVN
ncbi:hypothetical protein DFH07DRAFT_777003 [Mycena maculata]|uniref:Uncharacterized protein n=1 Tax=Mycena maculata TaxID=230809 RepID=A0AAD7IJT9_9AGAR|nr:hypothetical protein DFH07DRAFT_777003 [Mycena maculata]